MKISERTIKRLGDFIAGDKKVSPYRTGPELVRFFNDLEFNTRYGNDFGSRWAFAEQRIRDWNNTPELKKNIVSAFDLRDYMDATVFDPQTSQHHSVSIEEAVSYLNEFLACDGFEGVRNGRVYAVADRRLGEVLLAHLNLQMFGLNCFQSSMLKADVGLLTWRWLRPASTEVICTNERRGPSPAITPSGLRTISLL